MCPSIINPDQAPFTWRDSSTRSPHFSRHFPSDRREISLRRATRRVITRQFSFPTLDSIHRDTFFAKTSPQASLVLSRNHAFSGASLDSTVLDTLFPRTSSWIHPGQFTYSRRIKTIQTSIKLPILAIEPLFQCNNIYTRPLLYQRCKRKERPNGEGICVISPEIESRSLPSHVDAYRQRPQLHCPVDSSSGRL